MKIKRFIIMIFAFSVFFASLRLYGAHDVIIINIATAKEFFFKFLVVLTDMIAGIVLIIGLDILLSSYSLREYLRRFLSG